MSLSNCDLNVYKYWLSGAGLTLRRLNVDLIRPRAYPKLLFSRGNAVFLGQLTLYRPPTRCTLFELFSAFLLFEVDLICLQSPELIDFPFPSLLMLTIIVPTWFFHVCSSIGDSWPLPAIINSTAVFNSCKPYGKLSVLNGFKNWEAWSVLINMWSSFQDACSVGNFL